MKILFTVISLSFIAHSCGKASFSGKANTVNKRAATAQGADDSDRETQRVKEISADEGLVTSQSFSRIFIDFSVFHPTAGSLDVSLPSYGMSWTADPADLAVKVGLTLLDEH